MKHVILIHAHKDLDQLNSLVDRLADENFIVFVNVDLKSPIDVSQVHPRARLVQRRSAIHWGQFSQVEATLNSLSEIVAAVPEFGKVLFISAQDFPLLPNAQLLAALAALADKEVLECAPIGPGGWECAHRYQYFYPAGRGAVAMGARLLQRAMRLLGLRRRIVGGMRPFGGSSWWALSRACIVHVLAMHAADPAIARFFRTVSCPDELFFQTLIMQSPFASRVLSTNLRYIQWPATGARNPAVLTAADYPRIASADAHFCRKLEPAASAALIPMLEALLRQRAGASASAHEQDVHFSPEPRSRPPDMRARSGNRHRHWTPPGAVENGGTR